MQQLNYSSYYNKVLGGWIGKCAGGILGAPIEGIKAFNGIELSDDLFSTNFPNDDLDLQVLWLDMVKKKGPFVRETDFADHWKDHVGFPWNEYGIATRNIRLGAYPPESGFHNNYYWNASMGCPIRSEIWGMLCPGNPSQAMFYAQMDGSLDHHGFSVQAEQFLSACAAIAFFENDIPIIFNKALEHFKPEDRISQLVSSVIEWNSQCDYRTAMGKIKSYWGDADFTSAPMNIGFTLLALLRNGDDFNCVMDALHMGHDSDCVAATAGALVGIIQGYDAIPENWKKMVGNELLISQAISGLDLPDTITDLAKQTCKAGISFVKSSNKVSLTGEVPEPYAHSHAEFHLLSYVSEKGLLIRYENLSDTSQEVVLELKSSAIEFSRKGFSFRTDPGEHFEQIVSIEHTGLKEASTTYLIEMKVNGKKQEPLKRGLLSYGSWLMIGPFIEEDEALKAQNPNYPEHGGMLSMPSVDYMNHDRHSFDKDFLSLKALSKLTKREEWNSLPFMVQEIFPKSFEINLADYYYGKGERTIYLYSALSFEADIKLWLSMGCTSPFKLWINGSISYMQEFTSRCWIGNSIIPVDFKRGKNDIVLKLDLITDNNQLEVGFKEYTGKHPHQEHWSLLIPKVEIYKQGTTG